MGIIRRLTRSKAALRVTGFLFSQARFLLPMKILDGTRNWTAFRHPKPAYPIHLVIVPNLAAPDVFSLPLEDPRFTGELVDLVNRLIQTQGLDPSDCRLVINGGSYQTFPQAHVHLINGPTILESEREEHQ